MTTRQTDNRQEQCETCSRWYLQVKNHQIRGCCGSPDDSIDYVLDAPPHQAASEPDATDSLALPSADEDSESCCVTPPADSSEEQDLCKHMLDYITGSVQQMDTDRESARPEPNQEAEIMAFLMKRLSGKHRLWC
ncbi:TPA: hypothetical protein ACH3X1_010163 [Trebouxia sp. C0004]